MAIDITLLLDDQPGALARVGEVLGRAGVNIEGLCAVTSGGGQAEVHVLVEDLEVALPALFNPVWPSAPSRRSWWSPSKIAPAPSVKSAASSATLA
jgi:ACT domain